MRDKAILELILTSFAFASAVSLGNLIRSNRKVGWNWLGVVMSSGFAGVGVACLWTFWYPATDMRFVIVVSILAGTGGISLLDLLLTALTKRGIQVKVDISQKTRDDKDN